MWRKTNVFVNGKINLSSYVYCHSSLFIYLCIYLFIYLSIYRSIDLSIYLFIYLSIYRSIDLSIYLTICLSGNSSISLSICISIGLPIYLSAIHLSIYLPLVNSFQRAFLNKLANLLILFSCIKHFSGFCHNLVQVYDHATDLLM